MTVCFYVDALLHTPYGNVIDSSCYDDDRSRDYRRSRTP